MKVVEALKDLFGNVIVERAKEREIRAERLADWRRPVWVRYERDRRWHVYAGHVASQRGSRSTQSAAERLADEVYAAIVEREKDWPAAKRRDRDNWKSNIKRRARRGLA